MKKIVAIGGGENGRKCLDGTFKPYETGPMDKEIIRLTGKEHPNFLFLAHSQPLERQNSYFEVMRNIYLKMYGCPCKDLKSDILDNKEEVKKLIDWADIIYEGGGNTLDMIKLWKKTGFDKILRKAWEDGKVMCGVSAGANCWFEFCSSDALKIKYGSDAPLISVNCLGFLKGMFVPHCDEGKREESAKEMLKDTDITGILMSNCAAIEIIDDKYKVIYNNETDRKIKPYGLLMYFDNDICKTEEIKESDEYRNVKGLYRGVSYGEKRKNIK